MTDEAKTEEKSWKPGDGVKAVGTAIKDNPGHAVVGAVIGQVLIPIPLVGAAIGAAVGGWIGKRNAV